MVGSTGGSSARGVRSRGVSDRFERSGRGDREPRSGRGPRSFLSVRSGRALRSFRELLGRDVLSDVGLPRRSRRSALART